MKLEMTKGYMIQTNEMKEQRTEQLFARFEDGTIITCTKKWSTSFNEKDATWIEVDSIPADAEFIGNYKMIKAVK